MSRPSPYKRLKVDGYLGALPKQSRKRECSSESSVTLLDADMESLDETLPNKQAPRASPPNFDRTLFYDEKALARQKGPRLANRVLPFKSKSAAYKSTIESSDLVDGWISEPHSVNLFIEAAIPEPSAGRQCHLKFTTKSAIPGIKAGDVRHHLAKHSRLEPFSIQIEHQSIVSRADSTILDAQKGTCRRPLALWDDVSLDDRVSLSEFVSEPHPFENGNVANSSERPPLCKWLRVSHAEYLLLDMADSDFMVAITPEQSATVGNVRELAAKLRSTKPTAVRLQVGDTEIMHDEFPLQVLELSPQSIISCWLEHAECALCGDDEIPYAEFEQWITPTCAHKREACSGCVQRWIVTKLDNGEWDTIGCPGDECKEVLQHSDLIKFLTPEKFERYTHLSVRAALGAMDAFKWCVASGCESGQIHEENDGEVFTCHACNSRQCANCDRAWHEWETCLQYKARTGTAKDQEDASEMEVEKISKECPGCKMRIQKDGGCEHITCRKCRHQFCWLCLASYTDINRDGASAHKPTCMYHNGRTFDPHAVGNRFMGGAMMPGLDGAMWQRLQVMRDARQQPNNADPVGGAVPLPPLFVPLPYNPALNPYLLPRQAPVQRLADYQAYLQPVIPPPPGSYPLAGGFYPLAGAAPGRVMGPAQPVPPNGLPNPTETMEQRNRQQLQLMEQQRNQRRYRIENQRPRPHPQAVEVCQRLDQARIRAQMRVQARRAEDQAQQAEVRGQVTQQRAELQCRRAVRQGRDVERQGREAERRGRETEREAERHIEREAARQRTRDRIMQRNRETVLPADAIGQHRREVVVISDSEDE